MKNRIQEFVENLTEDQITQIIVEYNEFENKGQIGNCFLRICGNKVIEILGMNSSNICMVMDRLAFEAYRYFYNKEHP